jgi:hypothetical protein
MKFKRLFLLLVATTLMVGCANIDNSSQSHGQSSKTSSALKSSSSNRSSTRASSSINSSSKAQSTSTARPMPSSYFVPPTDAELKAPIVTFNTVEGQNLDFATKPNRTTNPRPEVIGTITTSNCDEDFVITNAVAEMRVRGNYTANYRKKPFRIKFDSKTNFFGLNNGQKYKKWVLLADVKDSSLSRNAVTYFMAEKILDGYYVPDFTPVHLYINNNYWGMYLLGENKEVNPGRVDINEPKEGYTGVDIGYFFELDSYWKEAQAQGDYAFEMKKTDYIPAFAGNRLLGEEEPADGYTIASEITNPQQVTYLQKRVKNTYTALYKAIASSPKVYQELNTAGDLINSSATSSEEAVSKLIDIDSFVNTYILNEIACDADIGRGSFYFSLDMSAEGNKLLTMNCPWDWDSSLGLKVNTVESAEQMFAAFSSNPWFALVCKADWFMQKVQTRWQELLEADLFNRAYQFLDNRAELYVEDYKKNFEKWPHTIGKNTVDEGGWLGNNEVRPIYHPLKTQAENKDLLKQWIQRRVAYLTTMYNGELLPANSSHPVWTQNGKEGYDSGGSGGNPDGGGGNPDGWWNVGPNQTPQQAADAFKQGVTPYRLEAEDAAREGGGQVKGKSSLRPDEVLSGNNGGQYVSELNPNPNIKLAFTYVASKDCQAIITLGISRREDADYTFDQFFTLEINSAVVGENSIINVILPRVTETRANWNFHYWTNWDVAAVNFNSGQNTIVFTTKNACSNLDYIDIYAK